MTQINSYGRMYEYIQNFDEPTILIFFGDHLPYLYNAEYQKDVTQFLTYFNTGNSLLDTYRKYNTQCLILANFDLGNVENMNYLSADTLLTSVLNNMGLELSDYYVWLYNNKNKLPSSNFIVSQDVDGNLFWTNKLDGEKKEYFNEREKIQYNFLKR